MTRLVVVGAVNVDLVVPVPRLPGPGETVVGGELARHDGGKGGNQAVAAARALRGSRHAGAVAFVGGVGMDGDGEAAVRALAEEGIDTSGVMREPEAPTGVALIAVDPSGDNQITVAPGANARLAADRVERDIARLLVGGGVLLASLEVPLDAVAAALAAARRVGARTVLNPAPAAAEASDVLPLVDVATPNVAEAAALGLDRRLADGPAVCVTMGRDGALVRRPGRTDVRLPALAVTAVDAIGAGDTFSGVLAAALLEERPLEDAARRAIAASGLSVSVPGARAGMPFRSAIDAAVA